MERRLQDPCKKEDGVGEEEEAGGGAEEAGSRTPSRPRISARGLGNQIPAAAGADRLTYPAKGVSTAAAASR